MEAKKKNNYLVLLLIPVCSLCAANSYANIYVQHNRTKQDKKTKGTEPTEKKEGADATEAKEGADATEAKEGAKPTEAKEAANPTGATEAKETTGAANRTWITKPTEKKEEVNPTEAKETTGAANPTWITKPTEKKERAGTQSSLKLSGSFAIKGGYTPENYQPDKPFYPSAIQEGPSEVADDGDSDNNLKPSDKTPFIKPTIVHIDPEGAAAPKDSAAPKDPFSTSASATLALEKTILWEGKPVKLNVGMVIGQGSTKLSKVSAKFESLVLGLQASNFGSSDLSPSCIGAGPNSAVGNKALQLRFNQEQFLFPWLSLALSVEKAPDFKISEKYKDALAKEKKKLEGMKSKAGDIKEDERKACEDRIKDYKRRLGYHSLGHQPALAVSLRCKYPESRGHLDVAGLVRWLQHSSEEQSFSPLAGGICVGTKFNVWPERTTIKLQVVVGRGIGPYIAGLGALEKAKEDNTAYVVPQAQEAPPAPKASPAPETGDAAKASAEIEEEEVTTTATVPPLRIINAGGGYLAVEHCWDQKKLFRSTFVVSRLGIINGDDRDQDCYQAGLYGSMNLTYHPTEEFHLGVELLGGQKSFVDPDKIGRAYAVRIVVRFKF